MIVSEEKGKGDKRKGGQARLLTRNRDYDSLWECRVPHELLREGCCSTS